MPRRRLAARAKEPKVRFAGRAAEYLRVSSNDQRYSLVNQHRAILAYAEQHGLAIVRAYADAGRSGVTAKRPELQRLIEDVQSSSIDFSTILVHDDSRWGRFQDIDESAYYEFICKKFGVSVVYCAEQFGGTSSITGTLAKAIKRVMAAEFSRELSVRVFASQMRAAKRGAKLGGPPP